MNIVNKIKALLRLSKSPNPHEAELALTRAFEIAAKYHIEIESLDLGEEMNRIVRESCRVGYRLSISKRLALGIVKKYFHATPIISYPDIVWIGAPPDIKIAMHVFYFLSDTCDRLSLNAANECGSRFTETRRKSFVVGFFWGVSSGLNKAEDSIKLTGNQYGLILARDQERREKYLEQKFPHTVLTREILPKRRDRNWLLHGYIKGKSTKIDRPINEHHARKEVTSSKNR